jgi:hypothetical protein
MPTDNKSPSYLQDREAARRYLTQTPDGKVARDFLIKNAPGGDASSILDDDEHVDWEDLVRENKGLPVLAANCSEARRAFDMARQARSNLGVPLDKHRWLKFFSAPLGYVLRKQIETCDPKYWDDPANLFREAMDHPEWCCVPSDVIRAQLEAHLPKGQKAVIGGGQTPERSG